MKKYQLFVTFANAIVAFVTTVYSREQARDHARLHLIHFRQHDRAQEVIGYAVKAVDESGRLSPTIEVIWPDGSSQLDDGWLARTPRV